MAFAKDYVDSGEKRLAELGYKQELQRSLSVLSNFAFSFSIISILTGITTLYNTGLTYGGPISMTYGWLIAGLFTMLTALSMAEICSAYPTSGGLYFWSYRLAGKKWGPFASWITGWFNIAGQWAVTTSVDFSLAQLLQVIILLSSGGGNGGVFVLMVLIPAVSPARKSTKFVFSYFNKDNGAGIHSSLYIFLIGLLMSQYTLSGYDASAHMSEETKSSDKNGAYGILSAVGISIVVGWAYLLGITFAVTDIEHLLDPANDARGYGVAQLFYDSFKDRYGNGTGGIVCLCLVAIVVFFCGMSSITSNSRMAYAFSRDGAMPFSYLWHSVNRSEVPIKAVWLSASIAFCMALPYLGSTVAFQAMVSIATIGLYIAYALPILFRITFARRSFVPGPFNLGRFGLAVGWVAVLWVATITVLFCLPISYPVTKDSLNYTPVAVGGIFGLTIGSWIFSARFWFKGPVANMSEKENGLL
ncbi:hypothetical protein O6H91_01G068200 [Diphasiastrum complanatum]|uniref:Uncharacterized protein n=1 Tax=Diphasiastrum complanatum TaxID=34168 RepID=A0ACC2ERM3_DIPCM|nr:hypothetical protein O6H91_01G068200 [Diphasiastrum complanatum]